MIAALAWSLFAGVVLVAGFVAYATARALFDARESERGLTLTVSTIGLFLALASAATVPVDLYTVSSDNPGKSSDGVRDIYLTVYGLEACVLFLALPFAYFYYEEGDPGRSVSSRVAAAARYMVATTIVVVVILVVGAVASGESPKVPQHANAEARIKALISGETKTEAAISFTVACLTMVGFPALATFAGCGMAYLPLRLIVGASRAAGRGGADSKDQVTESLLTTKERARAIQAKYISGRRMTKKDQKALDMLRKSERQLTRRSARIAAQESTLAAKAGQCMRPLTILAGVLALALSLLIGFSFAMGTADRAAHSLCGYDCGFVLARPRLPNPIDALLAKVGTGSPVDFSILLGLGLYLTFCTVAGLVRLSIRCVCFVMYRVRRRGTVPQGLLLSVFIVIIALMAANVSVVVLAPRYALYGSQTYSGGHLCSLTAPLDQECVISRIGAFVTRTSIKYPIIGTAWVIGTGLIALAFVGGLVLGILKCALSGGESGYWDEEDSYSDDDFW